MAERLRVLIVDDSAPMRFILRGYVEELGHEVVAEADSPEGAVEEFKKHKPDAVTLDLSLIGGDGLSVLRSLRDLAPAARVVVVSANAQKKVQDAVLAGGAAAFVSKPVEPEALKAALGGAAA